MIEPDHVNYIDLELMEKMCHPLAVAVFENMNDPITQFKDHERALLESALNNPTHGIMGKEFYPTLAKKAAILYYGLIKNHAFRNGNKRIATATLLVFLYINDRKLDDSDKKIEDYLVNLAKRVADSLGNSKKEEFLQEIEVWLEEHLTPNK
jgi:death-on-curing family protein